VTPPSHFAKGTGPPVSCPSLPLPKSLGGVTLVLITVQINKCNKTENINVKKLSV